MCSEVKKADRARDTKPRIRFVMPKRGTGHDAEMRGIEMIFFFFDAFFFSFFVGSSKSSRDSV